MTGPDETLAYINLFALVFNWDFGFACLWIKAYDLYHINYMLSKPRSENQPETLDRIKNIVRSKISIIDQNLTFWTPGGSSSPKTFFSKISRNSKRVIALYKINNFSENKWKFFFFCFKNFSKLFFGEKFKSRALFYTAISAGWNWLLNYSRIKVSYVRSKTGSKSGVVNFPFDI